MSHSVVPACAGWDDDVGDTCVSSETGVITVVSVCRVVMMMTVVTPVSVVRQVLLLSSAHPRVG